MGILLVYDVTEERTFSNIKNWIRNIKKHATDNVDKILIGNKCDMVDKKVIDAERGQALAKEYDIKFVETSAKNNINVEEAFITLAKAIKERLIDGTKPEPTPEPVEKEDGLKIVDSAIDSKAGQSPQAGVKSCC